MGYFAWKTGKIWMQVANNCCMDTVYLPRKALWANIYVLSTKAHPTLDLIGTHSLNDSFSSWTDCARVMFSTYHKHILVPTPTMIFQLKLTLNKMDQLIGWALVSSLSRSCEIQGTLYFRLYCIAYYVSESFILYFFSIKIFLTI